MLGAIIGDIVGSVYERRPIKSKDFDITNKFCTFTDDSVTTIGIAYAILNKITYKEALLKFCKKYPDKRVRWQTVGTMDYYQKILSLITAWGNGSAMRVSPVSLRIYNFS